MTMRNQFYLNVPLTIEREGLTYELTVSGYYHPARPAPHCSNPDSLAFSDPGDDAEFDWQKLVIDRVEDEHGQDVVHGHPLFIVKLKADQIELTSQEEDQLYETIENIRCD